MYLEKRRRLYYAVHDIPPALRECFGGKRKLIASLHTADPETARLEGAKKEAEWRHVIKEMRARLKAAGGGIANADGFAEIRVQLSLEADPLPAYVPPPPEAEPMRFDQWADDWAATQIGKAAKSIHMAKATIRKFSDVLLLDAISRSAAQRWVDDQIKAGVATATIRRSLSELRAYWKYLQAHAHVSNDQMPFERLALARGEAARRDAFPPAAIAALVNTAVADSDEILADAIRIGAFTGARIEEICALKLEDIRGDVLIIHGTKTDAASRQVPIHPQLKPTLKRLADNVGTDQFLLKGLVPNKFGDRSQSISKRFGRLKTALEYGDEYVFHSIRKTFASTLWSAGVERELISQMMGHTTGSITIDIYAKDPAFSTKMRAVKKVSYPGYGPA